MRFLPHKIVITRGCGLTTSLLSGRLVCDINPHIEIPVGAGHQWCTLPLLPRSHHQTGMVDDHRCHLAKKEQKQ